MWRRNEDQKPSAPAPDSAGVAQRPPARETVPAESPERFTSSVEPRTAGTRVSRAISIHGEITGREDLFIDGEVRGKIDLSGAVLTVGIHGRVTAEVKAKEIIVEGAMEGNLRATYRAEIRRSGSVSGDVLTERLVIEEGAVFRGRVEMAPGGEPQLPAGVPETPLKAAAASAGADADTIRVSALPADEQVQ